MSFLPRMRLVVLWSALAFSATVGAQPAQPPAGTAVGGTNGNARVAPDSPRGSLQRFRELGRRGRWAEAARYLDVPSPLAPRSEEVARRLAEVIEARLGWDLDALSAEPDGDPDDGLPLRVDSLGDILTAQGPAESVRIQRRSYADGVRWVFVRTTVQRVDGWYAGLEGRWAREHLPPWLNARGPRDLLWWQWLSLPLLLALSLAVGRVVAGLARWAVGRVVRRTAAVWDDAVPGLVVGPVTLFVGVAMARLGLEYLALYRDAEEFVRAGLRAVSLGAVFWVLWRSVDLLSRAVHDSAWAREHPGSVTLVPLGRKIGRVVVVGAAGVGVLSVMGYPVGSLVAGLGIGGLAVALAFQKTGEHLFGSLAIGLDQPFRVGDWVKIEDQEGAVESIGLRSTQLRTLDRTVVSIPNGKLADMRTETFTARDRFRMTASLALRLGTPAASVERVMEAIRVLVRAHPKAHQETLWVYLRRVGESSLEVEVSAWFETVKLEEFHAIRSEVLLQILGALEAEGVRLAYPTRTVHLAGGGAEATAGQSQR